MDIHTLTIWTVLPIVLCYRRVLGGTRSRNIAVFLPIAIGGFALHLHLLGVPFSRLLTYAAIQGLMLYALVLLGERLEKRIGTHDLEQ